MMYLRPLIPLRYILATYSYPEASGIYIIHLVALWDVIKHEKDRFVTHMKDIVNTEQHRHGELSSLHHEYSSTAAHKGQTRTFWLIDYITSIKSPFSRECSNKLINIVTKQEVQNKYYLLTCIQFGEKQYADLHTKSELTKLLLGHYRE